MIAVYENTQQLRGTQTATTLHVGLHSGLHLNTTEQVRTERRGNYQLIIVEIVNSLRLMLNLWCRCLCD